MLTNYVLVLANTGIRVGEARNLSWSDIDTFLGDDAKENIVLQVRGKTGAREVVARTLGSEGVPSPYLGTSLRRNTSEAADA